MVEKLAKASIDINISNVRLSRMEENKNKIKLFLSSYLRNYDLQDDEDIFSLGFINSLFAMQLVMHLEKEFEIRIEDEDLEIKHFKTVNAMAELIEHKKSRIAFLT